MKYVYTFGEGGAEGDASQKELLGGKGANLAEMSNLGLPIPAGFTIPTSVCVDYLAGGPSIKQSITANVMKAADSALDDMYKKEGNLFLVSVRSGARVSMPGMMDTILNIGITSDLLPKFMEQLGPVTALDCYRRLIQMYGNVVKGIPSELFEHHLTEVKTSKYGMKKAPVLDSDLSVKHLQILIEKYLEVYSTCTGESFPDKVSDQLLGAITAVFNSWNGERAKQYRKVNNIPEDWGTAVNVQMMVYGNKNDQSATGVLFSRCPKTGFAKLMGEYLVNAQGEDVVAGIRTPVPLNELEGWNSDLYHQLSSYSSQLEAHYKDMQDMEFTIQDGKLWMLQTRNGKRSAEAAFKIAYDMVEEGLISKEEALSRVNSKQYAVLLRPQIDPSFSVSPSFTGIPASTGIVSGKAVFSNEAAKASSTPCILVRKETTPEDFSGMVASVGILTVTGGATSHAAVVARGMDKACVVGASSLVLGDDIKEGDTVSIDGATGNVWVGVEVPVIPSKVGDHVREMLKWATPVESEVVVSYNPVFEHKGKWKEVADTLPSKGMVAVLTKGCNKGLNTKYTLGTLMKAMRSRKDLSGILDFTEGAVFPEDKEFLSYLGDTPSEDNTDMELSKKLEVLTQDRWSTSFKSRWVVNVPDTVSSDAIALIKASGWKTVTTATTLGELLNTDGILVASKELAKRLDKEGTALEEVITLLKEAGRQVQFMPKVVSKEAYAFTLLGN